MYRQPDTPPVIIAAALPLVAIPGGAPAPATPISYYKDACVKISV